MPAIPAPGRQKQEDLEFKDVFGLIASEKEICTAWSHHPKRELWRCAIAFRLGAMVF